MLIKFDKKNKFTKKNLFFALGFLCLLLVFLSFIFKSKIKQEFSHYLKEKGFQEVNKNQELDNALIKAPFNILKQKKLENIYIDIGFKNFQKLLKLRDKALKKGFLFRSKDDYVPIKIRHKKNVIFAEARLKGDYTEHLEGKKTSLRVKTKNKSVLFKMRNFSIQHPKARSYYGEPLFLSIMKKYGILVPRYKFVNVFINGTNIGTMAIEESFSKEILEHQRKREGVIFKFDDSLSWKENYLTKGEAFFYRNFKLMNIDVFKKNKMLEKPNLKANYERGSELFRGAVYNNIPYHKILDVKKTAYMIAIGQAFGVYHQMFAANLRFYLNPINMKFEPIVYDMTPFEFVAKKGNITFWHRFFINELIRKDKIIRKEFVKALKEISKDISSGKLLEFIKKEKQKYYYDISKEFFLLDLYDEKEALKRVKDNLYLANNPENFDYLPTCCDKQSYSGEYKKHHKSPKLLNASIIKDETGKNYLEIYNYMPEKILLKDVFWEEKNGETHEFIPTNKKLPKYIKKTHYLTKPKLYKFYFDEKHLKNGAKIKVKSFLELNNQEDITTAVKYYRPAKNANLDFSNSNQSFLNINNEKKEVTIKSGEYKTSKDILIEKGYKLTIEKGVKIFFNNKAGIISKGAVSFNGTKEKPVILYADKNKKDFSGLAVLPEDKNNKVTIKNTFFKNYSNYNKNGWIIPGGVTIYKSNVKIYDSKFIENNCEDALNIIKSDYEIRDSSFVNIASDAFDSDFSDGKVLSSKFENIGIIVKGGDAVDFSGSEVLLKNLKIKNIDDKGASIGEESIAKVENVFVENANISFASKDNSSLKIKNSKSLKARLADIAYYNKKEEFIKKGHIDYQGLKTDKKVLKIINQRQDIF